MSLILDALNRAEQERNEKNHIPTLQSIHSAQDAPRPSLLHRLHLERWLIGLVVAYLVFDYFSGRIPGREQAQAPSEVVSVVKQPAPAQAIDAAPPASTPAARPVTRPVEQPPVSKVAEPVVEKLAAVKPEPLKPEPIKPEPVSNSPAVAVAKQPAKAETPAAAPQKNPRVESLYKAPRPAPVTRPSRTESTTPASSSTASARLSSSERAYLQADEITALSQEFRTQIPSLKYNNHAPAAAAADGRVTLNGATYKPGDEVAPGLQLLAIAQEGIVLEFQGQKFRLQAYNSWINFQ
jgi:general secretion pathway protein B